MNETLKPQEPYDRPSKYELVMIAAREARRLNESARAVGKELRRRVTDVAWERLEGGKIRYTYSDEPVEGTVEAAPEEEAPDFETDAEAARKSEDVDTGEEASVPKGA